MGIGKRTRDSYKRPENKRHATPAFIIVCEGEITEPDYFLDFPYNKQLGQRNPSGKYYGRSPIIIEGGAGQWSDVVKKAKILFLKSKREGMLINSENVWCVFDCDNNQHKFNEAIQMAKKNGFNAVYSNVCFELWYALHFKNVVVAIPETRYDRIISDKLDIDYSHGTLGMYELIIDKQSTALINAKLLEDRKAEIDEQYDDPSISVHNLVNALNHAYENNRKKC